ncbi:Serine/threonine-protein phosphatase PP2A-2 catalytic subunit [Dirofilaria immitis]
MEMLINSLDPSLIISQGNIANSETDGINEHCSQVTFRTKNTGVRRTDRWIQKISSSIPEDIFRDSAS